MSASALPSPLGLHLPALTPALARSTRLANDARLAQRLAALDGTPSLHDVRTAPEGPLLRLLLAGDDGTTQDIVFAAGGRPSMALLAAEDLAPEGLAAALEIVFAPLVRALAELGLPYARVAGLSHCDSLPAAGTPWCRLMLAGRDIATFALPALASQAASALHDGLPAGHAANAVAALCLRGTVELSRRPLRRSLLLGLAPGDVLLLEAADDEQPLPKRVRFGAAAGRCWVAEVHVEDTTITLAGEPTVIEDDLDDEALADPDEEPASLDDLSVPVRFEIDTLAVRLGDLAAYGPGAVITLSAPLSSATVRLVACGQCIGTAELVAVGEHLGARVLRIGLDHGE